MNVGDNILCKKDYTSKVSDMVGRITNRVVFIRGNSYKVLNIWEYFSIILVSEPLMVFGNLRDMDFSININKFDEYFYTKKELRKLKLESLNIK